MPFLVTRKRISALSPGPLIDLNNATESASQGQGVQCPSRSLLLANIVGCSRIPESRMTTLSPGLDLRLCAKLLRSSVVSLVYRAIREFASSPVWSQVCLGEGERRASLLKALIAPWTIRSEGFGRRR